MKAFAPTVTVDGNTGVPVNVGDAEKTKFPVPVVPVTEDARFAAVIVEVRFDEPSVATRRDAVRPVTVRDGVLIEEVAMSD